MKTIGIYLLKQKDEVVYVGQSIDVDLRIKTHKKVKVKQFDNVHIIECDRCNLDSAEAFYIHYYMPIYNKKMYEIRVGVNAPRTSKGRRKSKDIYLSYFNKPTDKNIAKFYDTTPQTLFNWKTSDKQGVRDRYKALKAYFIEQTKDK